MIVEARIENPEYLSPHRTGKRTNRRKSHQWHFSMQFPRNNNNMNVRKKKWTMTMYSDIGAIRQAFSFVLHISHRDKTPSPRKNLCLHLHASPRIVLLRMYYRIIK